MRKIILTLLLILSFYGCARGAETVTTQTALHPEDSACVSEVADLEVVVSEKDTDTKVEKETDTMNIVSRLTEILGCSAPTAQSVLNTLETGVSGKITQLENVPDEYEIVVRFTVESGTEYYAFIGQGYFVHTIRLGAPDGKVVYSEIE